MNNSTPIDITNIPVLRHIVAEMKNARQPRLLKQDSETVAMLLPMGTLLEQNTQVLWRDYQLEKVHQALIQSAGTFAGVNRKELLEDIAHARTQESY